MSDDKEDYIEEHPTSINKRLNRLSVKKIKSLGKHWEEMYGEP
jgi:hypothetical protein